MVDDPRAQVTGESGVLLLDSKLSFQIHIEHLIKKLRKKLGFLYWNKSCFSITNRKTIV